MLEVMAIPALSDNYIWCLFDPDSLQCVIVDPGEASPVLSVLYEYQLNLQAILVTHHHWDHTGGISAIRDHHFVPVYGYQGEPIPELTHPLTDNEMVEIDSMGLSFTCLHIPGHTLGHVAFSGHGMLFTGDTLFTGGCGKIFEGDATAMYYSLSRLAALPGETLIYCGHEYTLNNLQFAKMVEPDNRDIDLRIEEVRTLRDEGQPSVPSTLGEEFITNPFLRTEVDNVIAAAQDYADETLDSPIKVLQTLREWKNSL